MKHFLWAFFLCIAFISISCKKETPPPASNCSTATPPPANTIKVGSASLVAVASEQNVTAQYILSAAGTDISNNYVVSLVLPSKPTTSRNYRILDYSTGTILSDGQAGIFVKNVLDNNKTYYSKGGCDVTVSVNDGVITASFVEITCITGNESKVISATIRK
ncbi:MAG: hypothetical protein NZ108_03005 [Bacteroidia bacterium]|nr:hypothetical protein [Bacteroidia bacterium]